MALPSIDQLMSMDDAHLDALKEDELSKLYKSAGPGKAERLKSLQWKIDMTVKMAPNKLAGCIQVSTMMNESFSNLRIKLNELKEIL